VDTVEPLYDVIGRSYGETRREDPRVAAAIHAGLGDARSVLNVGAGTGNYEPRDRAVVAVDPSPMMLERRPPGAAPAIRGVAEQLPFRNRSFDVAMGVLTVHHWTDQEVGLGELERVAAQIALLIFEPTVVAVFWLFDYFPTMRALPSEGRAPTAEQLRGLLDVEEIRVVPVPFDCTDGFGAAFYGRPEAYLRREVQAGMSCLAQLDPSELAAGSARLEADLDSGDWDRRFGELRTLPEMDCGYRLVLARSRR
jgi:SAM-dependent methyltransferase